MVHMLLATNGERLDTALSKGPPLCPPLNQRREGPGAGLFCYLD